VLSNKSGLLVSEFGQMGDEDGRLLMLSVSDGERTVLYASDMPCDSSTVDRPFRSGVGLPHTRLVTSTKRSVI
jgi:hypothetical protein